METLVDVRDVRTLDGLFVHRGRCASQVALLHRTIAYHHHFVQQLLVLFNGDVVMRLAGSHPHLLRCVTDVGDDQGLTRVRTEREVAVEVGGNTVRRALHHYTGSDDGAHGIDHHACDLLCLLHFLYGLHSVRLRRVSGSKQEHGTHQQRSLSKRLVHT